MAVMRRCTCRVCAGFLQVEANAFGEYNCPHCDASIPIYPNRERASDAFSFHAAEPRFVRIKDYAEPPVASVDPAFQELGRRLSIEMITGQRDFGLPIHGKVRREISQVADFEATKEDYRGEAGIALVALPVSIGLFFAIPFCGLLVLIAAIWTLFAVSNEQENLSSKLALTKQLGGVLEQGRVYSVVPQERLLLGFSWVDCKISLNTAQRLPVDHSLVVMVETTYSGDNMTPSYDNVTYCANTDGTNALPLMRHSGINSQLHAESFLKSEPWREFLSGPVLLVHQ